MRVALLFVAVGIITFLIFNHNSKKGIFTFAKKDIKGDTNIANHFNELAERYVNTNLEYSHKLAAKAAFFSKSMNYSKGEARAYSNLAEYNFLVNNDEKAIEYSDKASKIFEKRNDYTGLNKSKDIVAKIFLKHEMFDQAEDVYKKSLSVSKDLADNDLMATCYMNLGTVLNAQKRHYEAIHLFKRANRIYYKVNDLNGQASCYTDLGLTYKKLNDYNKSIASFEKALSLLNDYDNQKAFVYLEIGNAEANNFNLEKAIEYFKKAEYIESHHEDNYDLAVTLLKQSETYFELGKLDLALETGTKGLAIAQSVGNKEVEVSIYNIISNIYVQRNNYKLAFESKNKAELLDEELTNDSKTTALTKLQATMEFNKKLEQEKAEELKLKQKLDDQVSTHYLLIGMFIPILLTSVFFISHINISSNYIRAIVFVTIVLTLEFLLVVLDPFIDKYTGGIPITKLLTNTFLALLLAPLQHIMEKFIKKRVIKNSLEQKKSPVLVAR